jgi:hypothetical protein
VAVDGSPDATRAGWLTAVLFLTPHGALEAPPMDVEPKVIVNPWQQRADGERRVLRALRRHKRQHGVGDFVGAARSAFPGHQPRDPLLGEGGLRLIERRARDPECVGRPRHRLAVDVHAAEHFVPHLHEIPRVEKLVGREQRIAHGLRARMERARGTQGLRFGIAAGRASHHSQYNYAALPPRRQRRIRPPSVSTQYLRHAVA